MILTNPKNNIVTLTLFIVLMIIWPSSLKAQQEIPDNIKDQILNGIDALESSKVPEDINKALTLFKEAVNIAPEYPDAHYFLGKTFSMMQGFAGKAVKELERYLELYPEAPDAEKVKTEILQLKELIKLKNTFSLSGLSLIKLSDGIYVNLISPDFTARPTNIGGPSKRLKLVFVGDKVEKVNDVAVKDYSIQDVYTLIEKDTNNFTKLSLVRAGGTYKSEVFTSNTKKKNKYDYDLRDLGEEDLQTVIDETKRPLVVFFSSYWCQECEQYNNQLYSKANKHKESVSFIIANITESAYLSKEFSITQTPSIYMYKDGKLFDKIVGYDKELFEQKVEELINN